jgi:hypothetical protein
VLRRLIGYEIKPSSEHYNLVLGLWQRSRAYQANVKCFVVIEKLGGFGARAVMENDDLIDFSIRDSIAGNSTSHWSQLTGAMRNSIRPQIRDFKTRADCAIVPAF